MESCSEAVLKDLVQYYCDGFLYENAKFYAERLYYGNPKADELLKSEYLFLLAKCYHGEGKLNQTYNILKGDCYLPNRFLFAKCCLALSKYTEAEKALSLSNNMHPRHITESDLVKIPGGAGGLYLLGEICRREQRKEYAIEYFRQALKYDKNCWVAICALCEMGVNIDTAEMFGVDLSTAFDRVCASQEPISSVHALPSSTNAVAISEKEANANSDMLKFQRGHVMERRHIAEHLGNPSHSPPYTAMSLGLSSLALRMGFPSPGCMPSPRLNADVSNVQQFASGERVLISEPPSGNPNQLDSFSNYSNRAPLSAMGGEGEYSGYRTVTRSNGNNLFISPDDTSQVSIAHHGRPGQLFDTPGLTPISGRRQSVNGEELGTVPTFPMSIDRGVGSGNSSGLSLPPPPPDEGGDEVHTRQKHAVRGGDASRRRVSFGPSMVESPLRDRGEKKKIAARLSFSSAGGQGLTNDQHEEDDSDEFSGSRNDNAPPEKFQRLKDDDDDFEFETPGICTHQNHSSLASPQDVARILYDRIQKLDDGATSENVEHFTPAPQRSSRSLGKASRIPVPSWGKSIHNPSSSRQGSGHPQTSNSRGSKCTRSPMPTRQAPGRGAGTGRNSDAKNKKFNESRSGNVEEGSEMANIKECWDSGQLVVLSILCVFSQAYQLLCQYKCTECIRHLQQLPRRHYSCGWVQYCLGKAYFELNDYKAAQLAFQEMLRLEPFRVRGTEILSTTLWHLKREKELCALAQQVVEIDKFSPETWCVVGNCFSLQKEHDTALKFFSRSIQIDPKFTYAHTLSGHEYIYNEDLDKAQASFRDSIYHDDRHYNAWYGLGTIYLRQERIELAEYHFKRAISIHPTSSVLQTYLGIVLNAYDRLDKNTEAIMVLQQACKYDTRNTMLYFQLAHVLLKNGSQQYLEDALTALNVVKEYAPKEPPVHSTLGEVCHRLGRNKEALKHFNTAINLDHKQAAILKPMLDAIQDPYLNSGN